MAFDLAAWVVILAVASIVGRGVLALFRATGLRAGDRFVLSAWLGIIILAVALLGVSIVTRITPTVAVAVAAILSTLGILALRTPADLRATTPGGPPLPRSAVAAGIVAVAIGAAALASDRVTLYDSLVYHIGVIRWLRENGTVPGVALIHNRLGHISAWFTLAAAFESGPLTNRAANVPLGVALVLVGAQTAIATARIAARRAVVADWLLAVTSVALVGVIAAAGTATPSPDVPTNVLIVVAAWSLLIIAPNPSSFSRRLVPFVVALGACAMKLFAVPAALATGLYAVLASPGEGASKRYVRRVAICAGLAMLIVGPFVAANLVASGCPAYPSPIGCIDAPWSVGAERAADYAHYVRDVARWERRGGTSVGASLGWIVPWTIAHPVVAILAIASPLLGLYELRRVALVRSSREAPIGVDGVRALVAFGLFGITLAAWQAPAPRFLYAFSMLVPAVAVAVALEARVATRALRSRSAGISPAAAFVVASCVVGFVYALPSQKLNIVSAAANGARLVAVDRANLLLPAAPEAPSRLFRWRVNDVDLLTPVPRPIADTLGYHSEISLDASFEKCSTAPLPCTPYLPSAEVRLRSPAAGLAGGFVRVDNADLAGGMASCLGELKILDAASTPPLKTTASDASRCGDDAR